MLSAAFLIIVLIAAFGAPWLAPYGPVEGNPSTSNIPPVWDGGTWSHVLGTDTQGYDVLSRLMYGARTTMLIGFAVVFLAGTFGIILGLIAGYRGGRTDRYLMRWVDIQVAFPGLLIALIMIAVLGPSKSSLIFVLAFNGWMVYARMTRGIVLSAKERPYVEAAEMIGCKPRRVMFKHILPNLTSALAHPRRARVRPDHPRRGDAVVPRPRVAVPRGVPRGDGQQRPRRLLLAPPPGDHPGHRASRSSSWPSTSSPPGCASPSTRSSGRSATPPGRVSSAASATALTGEA